MGASKRSYRSKIGILRNIVTVTAGELHDNPERYPLDELSAVTLSAGIIPVLRARQVIAAAGPEPTPIWRQLINAQKVNAETKDFDREAGLHEGVDSMRNMASELLAHWDTLFWIPRAVRNFSTASRLAEGAADFPEGRMLIHMDDDSHGFSRRAARETARRSNVGAFVIQGKHNSAIFRPKEFVGHVKTILEKNN